MVPNLPEKQSTSDPPTVGSISLPSVSIKLGWLEASGSGALGIGGLIVLTVLFVGAAYMFRQELVRLLKRRDIL